MNMRLNRLLALSMGVLAVSSAYAGSTEALSSKSNCEKGEVWSGLGSLPKTAVDNLSDMTNGDISPALGLSYAYDLEKNKSNEARLFGYYMEGRALLMSGQEDSALDSFAYVATSGATDQTGSEIQNAAMQCVTHTLRANPGMSVPSTIATHLRSLSASANTQAKRNTSYELALDVLMQKIAEGKSDAELTESLQALSGSGTYESLARGLMAAERRDHNAVIATLSPLFPKGKKSLLADGLKHEETRARLTLARAYYATRQFSEASSQYLKIDHRSNETSEVLSELSWTYLQQKRYGEAVGAAVNLRLGKMRETFTPESLEVASMSLNELCQYQDSLRTVKMLEHDYEPSFAWLKNRSQSTSGPSLYSLAIASLKQGSATGVPQKITNEWVRSPLFISGQSEIHRLFGVKQRFSELLSSIKDESLTANASDQESLRKAALILQQRQASSFEASDILRTLWVDRIDAELTRRNARMLAELVDVRENSRMVKIEIFNGASHDMIWLRAHPEFKDSDRKFIVDKSAPSGSDVWNWGKVDLDTDQAEVWEDEMGAFRAHLQNHCSDKDRYMSVATASR